MSRPRNQAQPLARHDLKRRASGGIFIIATRGVVILLVGLGGNIVLARLLTPRDFGVVAIGMSVVLFASMLSDGGLGVGLIRRREPPKLEELQSLTGFQLAATTAFALLAAAAAAPFGEIGWVTALMLTSVPLVALQLPGRILLERSLSYRPLAVVEVSQVVAYYAWAIGLVAAGFGVWGLASATVAMRAVAAAIMGRVSPCGLVRPAFSWNRIRSLVGFGVRFQAADATWLVRDQGLNVAVAVLASVSTLGIWTLARRLLEVPFLVYQSLFRVAFPTMSHLVAANEDVAPLIERAIGMAAVGSGVVLTGLAGSSPGLIPGIFGDDWRAASSIMPGACLGLGIASSVTVSTNAYLYAVGDASAVLRAALFHTGALFVVTVPLLPFIGVSAIGIGLLVSALAEVAALRKATRKWIRVSLVRPLLAPVFSGIFAGAAGWVISSYGGGSDLLFGIIGGLCSVSLFLASLFVFRRELFHETLQFAIHGLRAGSGRLPAVGAA
jgi:O-antigen/teichoic acid export membrane protein